MEDPRVRRLADLLTGYSLGLGKGDVVRVDGGAVATPLLLALVRSAVRRGAHPYPHVVVDGVAEILLQDGGDDQIEWVSPVERKEIELVDAMVTIWGDEN